MALDILNKHLFGKLVVIGIVFVLAILQQAVWSDNEPQRRDDAALFPDTTVTADFQNAAIGEWCCCSAQGFEARHDFQCDTNSRHWYTTLNEDGTAQVRIEELYAGGLDHDSDYVANWYLKPDTLVFTDQRDTGYFPRKLVISSEGKRMYNKWFHDQLFRNGNTKSFLFTTYFLRD